MDLAAAVCSCDILHRSAFLQKALGRKQQREKGVIGRLGAFVSAPCSIPSAIYSLRCTGMVPDAAVLLLVGSNHCFCEEENEINNKKVCIPTPFFLRSGGKMQTFSFSSVIIKFVAILIWRIDP